MEIINKITLAAAMLFAIGSVLTADEVKTEEANAPATVEAVETVEVVEVAAPQEEIVEVVEAETETDECANDGESDETSLCEKLIMYFPNRFADLMDIFSIELGLGYRAGLNVITTRAVVTGANIGASADMIKGYNRQYGFAINEGWDAHFLTIGAEDSMREYTVGNVVPYWEDVTGMSVQEEEIYSNKTRDYWAFGIDVSALVHVKFLIHPISFADFFTGLICCDLEDDDYRIKKTEN